MSQELPQDECSRRFGEPLLKMAGPCGFLERKLSVLFRSPTASDDKLRVYVFGSCVSQPRDQPRFHYYALLVLNGPPEMWRNSADSINSSERGKIYGDEWFPKVSTSVNAGANTKWEGLPCPQRIRNALRAVHTELGMPNDVPPFAVMKLTCQQTLFARLIQWIIKLVISITSLIVTDNRSNSKLALLAKLLEECVPTLEFRALHPNYNGYTVSYHWPIVSRASLDSDVDPDGTVFDQSEHLEVWVHPNRYKEIKRKIEKERGVDTSKKDLDSIRKKLEDLENSRTQVEKAKKNLKAAISNLESNISRTRKSLEDKQKKHADLEKKVKKEIDGSNSANNATLQLLFRNKTADKKQVVYKQFSDGGIFLRAMNCCFDWEEEVRIRNESHNIFTYWIPDGDENDERVDDQS